MDDNKTLEDNGYSEYLDSLQQAPVSTPLVKRKHISRVARLKSAIAAFHAVQEVYAKYGAWDTEPSGTFRRLVALAYNEGANGVKHSGDFWELFTCSMPCGKAARALGAAANKVVKLIIACPTKDRALVGATLQRYAL